MGKDTGGLEEHMLHGVHQIYNGVLVIFLLL